MPYNPEEPVDCTEPRPERRCDDTQACMFCCSWPSERPLPVSSRTGKVKQINFNGRNEDSNVISTTMGCSHSIGAYPVGTPIGDSAHKQSMCQPIQKNNGFESSSGEEDPIATEIDLKGRGAASDADLINVQRSEKTDVSAGLEDRWLRSHFSGGNRGSSEFERIGTDCQIPAADDKLTQKCGANSERSASVRDVKLGGSQKCVTIPSRSLDNFPQLVPNDVRKRLSILHFNDVYDLNERKKEPVGGAARFAALFEKIADKVKQECCGQEPLIAFSGDCLNPSILSSATKGKHMVEVLNQLKVTAAVFGNHEFDFGVDHAIACTKSMNFPWFLSNATEKVNGEPLGDGVIQRIISWNGLKVGVMGLIEEEWLDTLTTVDKCELVFQDYVIRGNELVQKLRDDGADLVIALTHMRWPNDIRLAQEVKGVDLILGGHDHEYGVKVVDECVIVKSGSDFQTFSLVNLFLKHDGALAVSVTRYDVTSDTSPCNDMLCIVKKYTNVLDEQLQQSIGTTKISLDGIYKHVRSRETNLGNFVADIMRMTTRAEIVLINSGTFRSNSIHDAGEFRVRDLMRILPIHDNVVVLEVTGQQLLDGLENAVSKYPRHEGRFAQISGFCFGFDPKATPCKRIIQESVKIHGEPIDLKKTYRLATKAYVARGRDGYECFSSCRLFNDPDSGPVVSTVVRNHISNVSHLLRHEKITGEQLRVTEGGKKIMCRDGRPHEVYSMRFDDAPVHKLLKSMEEIMPKNLDLDMNGNRKTRDSELTRKRDFVDGMDKGLHEGRAMHMQHLIEINCGDIFNKSMKTKCRIESARRKAIEADKDNLKLLNERQKTYEDVRWQVLPLLEGRIFHCSKK